MLEERIVELIHRDIDREIAEPEKTELHNRLAQDPDAKLFYDSIKSVAEFLEQAPVNDPPARFSANVMAAVRTSTNSETLSAPSRVVAFPRKYAAVSLGLGLAAAVLIAFIVAPSLFHSVDSSKLGGTMLEPPHSAAPQTWTEASGAIGITSSGNAVVMNVAAASSAQKAEITFDPSSLRIESIDGAATSAAAPGHIQLSIGSSPAVLKFVRLTREPLSLNVRLQSENAATISSRIDIPAVTNF